ncbi:MAG: hypothetical protein KJ737_27530 [Proteobacteria bacterium]|nr:hypothetical protein [Pseudomonadota bacterium]
MEKRVYFLFVLTLFLNVVLWGCDNSPDVDIRMNGQAVDSIIIKMTETVLFENVGKENDTEIEWAVQYTDSNAWDVFASGDAVNTAELKFMRPGTHQVRCKLKDGIWDTVSVTVGGNNYPIVLISGFLGWQRNELRAVDLFGNTTLALYQWGLQSGDLEGQLNKLGFDVYYAHAGPLTSAWDRACEVYASLTGGTWVEAGADPADMNYVPESGYYVDYGAKHAMHYSELGVEHGYSADAHRRFGNPQLAEPLVNSKGERFTDNYHFPDDPIHLIVHSHGGLTARVFMGLLKYGSPNGDEGFDDYPASGLFGNPDSPNKNFVRSLTTLASPHNGTTITYWAYDLLDFVDYLTGGLIDVVYLLSEGTLGGIISPIYNVDLDFLTVGLDDDMLEIEPVSCYSDTNEWGYMENDGRLKSEYRPPFDDFSLYDLSPCGAREINMKYPIGGFKDETYFFSYNGEQSYKGKSGSWYSELGNLDNASSSNDTDNDGFMCPIFELLANAMGAPEFSTGMAMTPVSVSRLQSTDSDAGNYVPEPVLTVLTKWIDNVPGLLDLATNYLVDNDLSRGWKFKDENELRDKIEKIIGEDQYANYGDTIITHAAYHIGLTEDWREFDGIVNTYSSAVPWTDPLVDGTAFENDDPTKPVPNPNLKPQTGKWLYMDKLHNDHYDMIGSLDMVSPAAKIRGENTEPVGVKAFYEKHATLLWQLPQF